MVTGAKTELFPIRLLKGYGYLFLAQVMSFFLNLSITVLLQRFGVLQILGCVCTTLITLGLQFNWAFNCAKKDEVLDRQQIKPYDRFMPAKMAAGIGIVPIGLYITLILSRFGVTSNFFPLYMFLSMWQLPYRNFFTDSTEVANLSLGAFIGFGVLNLLIPATIAVTYILIKRGTDFSGIVYKKDK
jgi:hypothetical protein